MLTINIILCAIGFTLGGYTFVRHLKGFNKRVKTPTADAWLVAVGTLGWSVLLYASIDEHGSTAVDVFSHGLLLICWAGSLLQVQKHCLKLKLRKRKLERVE